MAKSYFAILGITPLASAGDIRSAYRRLAKEYHTYSKMTMP
jgi:curved DNA-binding protein CbpA